jgi:soluble cytochrome b562/ABC-type glycerol-3-phosphate transport system substrate-binding protein
LNALYELIVTQSDQVRTVFVSSNLKNAGDLSKALNNLKPDKQKILRDFIDHFNSPEEQIKQSILQNLRAHMAKPGAETHGAFTDDDWMSAIEARVHYFNMVSDLPRLGSGGGYYHHDVVTLKSLVDEPGSSHFVEWVKATFEKGYPSVAAILEDTDGNYFATLALSDDGDVLVLNSTTNRPFLDRKEQSNLRKLVALLNNAEIGESKDDQTYIDFDEVKEVHLDQQRDGHDSLIYSILNAHQIAKEGKIEAHKSVTASFAHSEIHKYEDIHKIGSHQHGNEHETAHEGNSREFLASFRKKTQELIREMIR